MLWDPLHPNAPVAGTLRFNRESGVTADLVGSLDPETPVATGLLEPSEVELTKLRDLAHRAFSREPGEASLVPNTRLPVVFGLIPSSEVTLLNVDRTGGSSSVPGPTHEVLSCDALVRGSWLDLGLDALVSSLIVDFDSLADWYDTAAPARRFATTMGHAKDGGILRWRAPHIEEAQLSFGHVIALRPRLESRIGQRGFQVGVHPEFVIRFETLTPTRLRDAIEFVTPLRWFDVDPHAETGPSNRTTRL